MDPQAEPMMPADETTAEETTEATPEEENKEENAQFKPNTKKPATTSQMLAGFLVVNNF